MDGPREPVHVVSLHDYPMMSCSETVLSVQSNFELKTLDTSTVRFVIVSANWDDTEQLKGAESGPRVCGVHQHGTPP